MIDWAPMRGSRLTLVLLLYLSADIASPLMPGAVYFDNGALETVDADRSRTVGPPVVALVPTRHGRPGHVVDRPALVAPRARPAHPPRGPVTIRRMLDATTSGSVPADGP